MRHLSISGRKVYIRIEPARYQCPYCEGGPTTTQKLSWYRPRSPHTEAFDKHILLACVNSTIADVSMKEDIGYEATMGTIDRHINEEADWDNIERLETIGIDEVSQKKGTSTL